MLFVNANGAFLDIMTPKSIVVGRYSPRLLQETNSESANEQNVIEINKAYEQY